MTTETNQKERAAGSAPSASTGRPKANFEGGYCPRGHHLVGNAINRYKGSIRCKVCSQNRRREKEGLPTLDYMYDRRQDQQKSTHCKRGHEYVEGSYYERVM